MNDTCMRTIGCRALLWFVATWPLLAAAETPTRLPRQTPEQTGMAAATLDQIDELVNAGIAEGKLPGAVVMIGHRGSIVFHRAYGQRQTSPEPLPMEPDTVFDLASLTKPIATATAVMRLVDAGQIELDDAVGQHLPRFANRGKEAVTVRQLLLHVGGLIPDNSMNDYQDGPEQSIEKFLNLGLNYEPGSNFRYSDVGFQVLGELIRAKTGQDVAQYAAESIFEPLGMLETTYLPAEPLRLRAATTQQREGRWMVGEVHDPRAYAMGGIAGHAGLFSTADDLAVYAQMMLCDGSYGDAMILKPDTVRRMTRAYDVPRGVRGLGWDKRSGYSSNRGKSMTEAAFGHGGFTGTAIWIDPGLDLFVVFLSNRVHPDGSGAVNPLAGEIGTVAADAAIAARAAEPAATGSRGVRCGIDVLVEQRFAPLAGRRVGLITNHTGIDRTGVPTRIVLHQAAEVDLVRLLSPEHGIAGKLDQPRIDDTIDPETGLKVHSLYGRDRKPSAESLAGIDTLVFDIQDIGCRFYTYISTMGEAMRAAADAGLRFVVLDRPNPINGIDIGGPLLDAGSESFVGYHTLPVRHGMTVGEIASMLRAELSLDLQLEVIRCEGWNREDFFERSGLIWVNPSPNMRNLNQALLYPGIGLLETTNLSVGRGTDTPFELIGAPWLDAPGFANELMAIGLPGVIFIPTRFTPTSSKFADQACQGIQILITRRDQVDPIRTGLAIAATLVRRHPQAWDPQAYNRLLGNRELFQALTQGSSLEELIRLASQEHDAFLVRRQAFLLY